MSQWFERPMHEVAVRVYRGLWGDFESLGAMRHYLAQVVITCPAGAGGIVIFRSDGEPRIGWVDVYCPRALPRFELLTAIMVRAQFHTDLEWLAIDASSTDQPELVGRIARRLGFYPVGENLYSIEIGDPYHEQLPNGSPTSLTARFVGSRISPAYSVSAQAFASPG